MAVIHISESETGLSLSDLIAKVRAGEDVWIDSGSESFAIVPGRPGVPKTRTISEAIRLAELRNENVLLDDKFGDDMEAIIKQRENEYLKDAWE